jgi:hypothetical protein
VAESRTTAVEMIPKLTRLSRLEPTQALTLLGLWW